MSPAHSVPLARRIRRLLGSIGTLAAAPWLAAQAAPPASAQAGVFYQVDFAVTGAPQSASSYAVTGLPPGLSVSGATFSSSTNTFTLNAPFGTITGTPTAEGSFPLTITAWEFANLTGLNQSYGYTLIVSPAPSIAPAFTMQPAGQTVVAGNPVVFSATASGTPAPAYQWQKDGVPISGATGNTFMIARAVAGDAGTYTVVASSSAGRISSAAATLTVTPLMIAPLITTQPVSRTTIIGGAVTFAAAASGMPEPTYQWWKDGAAISGATSSGYGITRVDAADAGVYTVVATNPAGSVISGNALLVLDTIPAGFDVGAYLARYPDVAAAWGADQYGAWLYYRDQGIYHGEVFDELFRVEEYLALYPELSSLFGPDLGGALLHWLTTGRIEGRLGRIPQEFSAAGYFSRNPDVAAAVGGDPILAWSHYWLYGIYEGRSYDEELRVFDYLAINADLTAVFVDDWRRAALHWLRYGRTEGRLGRLPLTFKVAEYLNRNPAVATSWGTHPTTVFLHYWLYGLDEGRTYDELFRVDEYLALNPDLATVFGTDRRGAFKHWVRYGQVEGRAGRNE